MIYRHLHAERFLAKWSNDPKGIKHRFIFRRISLVFDLAVHNPVQRAVAQPLRRLHGGWFSFAVGIRKERSDVNVWVSDD